MMGHRRPQMMYVRWIWELALSRPKGGRGRESRDDERLTWYPSVTRFKSTPDAVPHVSYHTAAFSANQSAEPPGKLALTIHISSQKTAWVA